MINAKNMLAFPGAQVGEIADPQAVRSVGGEVTLDEIRPLARVGIGDRGAPRLPAPLSAADALLAHQTSNVVAAELLALAEQLVPHAGVAVALEVVLVQLANPGA